MKKITVLHVEDSISDSDLILRVLKKAIPDIELLRVDNTDDMYAALTGRNWDIVLSDFSLPQFNGLVALKLLQELRQGVPFIAVSGTMGEETAVAMMKAGAHDYIMKSNLARLPPAVEREIAQASVRRERLQMLKDLEMYQSRLRAIVQTIPDMIWLKDLNGAYMACNNRFEEFFGAPESEIISKTDYDYLQADQADFFRKHDQLAIEKGGPSINEEWITFSSDGHRVLLETIKTPVRNYDGQIFGVLGIARDITERKRLLEDLVIAKEKAEAGNRLKQTFMNLISHEIRTPLNGILGFGEMIIQPDLTQDEKEKYLDILNKSSERLLNTITNYIDVSLITSDNQEASLRPFNLNAVLRDVLGHHVGSGQLKNLEINLSVPPETDDFVLVSDAILLRKIFNHLIDNAIKFTDKGLITFGYEINPQQVVFFVYDTGMGISTNNLDRVFDFFSQIAFDSKRVYEGSGLGLPIVKGLLNVLGGSIRIESTQNVGSRIVFQLPVTLADQ